jgi:hypothetical protein
MYDDNEQLNIYDMREEIKSFSENCIAAASEEYEDSTHSPNSYSPTPPILLEIINMETFYSLSEEAQEVINIIISCPAELRRTLGIPLRLNQSLLKTFFHKKRGWKHRSIKRTFKEIKQYLHNN